MAAQWRGKQFSWLRVTCFELVRFGMFFFSDSRFVHELHACFDVEDYEAKVIINKVELTMMIYMVAALWSGCMMIHGVAFDWE